MIRYAFAFVLMSSVAFAGDNNGPKGGDASASAKAAAVAISGAKSSASVRSNINVSNRVTNKQAQGQFQGQEASASNSGVNINHERAIIAPSLGGFASGPCTGVGAQASVGVAGFGGGVGFTALDNECTRRETARVLHLLGQTEAAVQLMMAAPILQGIATPKRTAEVPTAETSDYCVRNKSDYYCKANAN